MLKKRPFIEYVFFTEAWFYLAISRCLILFIPFRKLTFLLGKTISAEKAEVAVSTHSTPDNLLRLIQLSILRAGRRSPWRTMCFEQALTARMMLRKRKHKSVIYFGLIKKNDNSDKDLLAHAWLICSGVNVTGGKNNDRYTIVGRFLN